MRYVGTFVVVTNEDTANKLQDRLDGSVVNVRYNPRDPSVSFIVDRYDLQFGGSVATQNPVWLDKATNLPKIA